MSAAPAGHASAAVSVPVPARPAASGEVTVAVRVPVLSRVPVLFRLAPAVSVSARPTLNTNTSSMP